MIRSEVEIILIQAEFGIVVNVIVVGVAIEVCRNGIVGPIAVRVTIIGNRHDIPGFSGQVTRYPVHHESLSVWIVGNLWIKRTAAWQNIVVPGFRVDCKLELAGGFVVDRPVYIDGHNHMQYNALAKCILMLIKLVLIFLAYLLYSVLQ